jgi:hypothetical protein
LTPTVADPPTLIRIPTMRSSKILQALIAAPLLALLLCACGSSSNSSSSNVSLRFINASKTVAMTVAVNGTVDFSAQAVQTASPYLTFNAGTYSVAVTGAGGALVSSTVTQGFGAGTTYTLIAYDRDGAIQTALIPENQPTPASGYGSLAVSNLGADPGSLDVYVVATTTTSLLGLAPTFQAVAYGSTPPSTTLATGNYKVVATAAGNVNDVRFTLPSFAVGNQQIQTLGFTSTPGGALVDGTLFTQSGGAAFFNATSARVRVYSALAPASSTPVAATVGGVLLPTVYSPIAGSYTLVPGGTTAYSLNVAGGVASLPAATFAAGGDYTILVFGTAAPWFVQVFADVNQAPNGGNINLRLVNAGVNDPAGVNMSYNGVPVASATPYGTPSSYFSTTLAPSGASIVLNAKGLTVTTPASSITAPQSVYTVFVIDSALTSSLVRDR